ncbi:hypothetical protein TIFTF001_010775 [Ficus carica]|uniref:Uncharacterized protein n=1 Tax=Ficus carica TaxID=3494 RepID=A0AA88ACT9_FICCA|nr:hypothetical protein TIFTF001_010775 [Ficus carica]
MLKKERPKLAEEMGLYKHEVQWPWSKIWPQEICHPAGKLARDLWKNQLGLSIRETEDKTLDSRAWKMQPRDHAGLSFGPKIKQRGLHAEVAHAGWRELRKKKGKKKKKK